ncbi:MAG: integrase core domain-containing protein [Methylovirgula sp.]
MLNKALFLGLDHARAKIANRVNDFNYHRRHSALGYQRLATFHSNRPSCCVTA